MIRLILVRHGNTFEEGQPPVQIGALTDLPLTSFGLTQAERMAQYLIAQKIQPKAIFAGNLQRQTQFAKIVGKPFCLSFCNEPALTELNYGAWEGLSSVEISAKWPEEYALWNKAGKWVTSVFQSTEEAHKQAIESWLNHLRKTYKSGDTILAISSNGLLRFFQRKEKVKTGHFCDLEILPHGLKVNGWNLDPKI